MPHARDLTAVLRALLCALLIGALAQLGSELLVPPSLASFSFGVDYQALSAEPLALRGSLPQRIFGPTLAWVLGLGGEHWPQFMRLCSALLLATVAWFVGRGGRWLDAALVAAAVAVSGAVQTYKRVVGFPDQLSFALLLLAVAAVRRPALFWSLNLASLLNHEMLVFFAPWLLWQRRRAGGRLRDDAIFGALAFALYGAFRLWVSAHAPQQTLNSGWYTGQSLFPIGTAWLWLLTLLYWVVDFGPLLVVLAFAQRRRERGDGIALLLFAGGIAVIYATVYVYDFFRFGSALCVPFVLAAQRWFANGGSRALFAALVAAAAAAFAAWHPGLHNLVARPKGYALIGDLDRITIESGAFADQSKLFTVVVPQVWPLLGAVALLLAVYLATGAWLGARAERCERADAT